ncbi:molybdopterin cofactor-binding domain-containing protein [Neorhizobium petrolearium]|uniref:molybdopterin cofactor-binding domain-containing protein n=1 Tax=Neorhizobium petrolearium TaxID=515361 RepID=UPI003F183762
MTASGLSVLHPASLTEAAAMASEDGSRLVAGGTALQLEWARGLPKPERLVSLGGIPGLDKIDEDAGAVRIGALTLLALLPRSPLVAERIPMLAAAAKTVAGPAVRNLGTIGGNIAGRNGCLLPVLLALDAELETVGVEGQRVVPLSDWLASPAGVAEIVAAIRLGPMPAKCRWMQRKVGLRQAFTSSVIGVAGLLGLEGERVGSARLAVGGGVVPPVRLSELEKSLIGRRLEEIDWPQLRARLGSEISAPDDAFRTGRYRRRVAANALVHGLSGGTHRQKPARRILPEGEPLADEIQVSHESLPDRWFTRPDVADKVAGRFAYLTDHRAEGMLVGRILRAGVPHATILSVDTSAAEALSGVAAVVTHRDVAGSNAFGIVVQDQPAFCFDKVRHAGDTVAAVAAVDAATAEAALKLIRVEYALLPVVDDPEKALAEDAPLVHARGNLQRILHFSRGDLETGFAAATHVVERTYVTGRQMHAFMETEGGYARPEADGGLSVFAGGQHGARDRLQLSRILGLPEEKIRVVTSPTGGAFGGKDELSVQPALALLALKSGRPVRLQLSRAESVIAGMKRNPMTIRMRTACDAEGRLLAQEVDVLADAGAYASLGPGVLETALEHAAGPYVVPNIRTRGRLAYTNNGICGAFRGFGANQMTYAIECQMDLLARQCGLTPLEIRRRNLREPGSPGYLGQEVSRSERLSEMLSAAAASPLWADANCRDDEVVGVGLALNYQGNGLGSVIPDPASGRLRLRPDGLIEAAYGLDEMGQGLLASIQAAVAAELGCSRVDVLPVTGDTALAPDSGSTSASRGGFVVWKVAQMAGPAFTAGVLAKAGERLDRDPKGLKLAPGGIADRLSNSGELLLSFRELAASIPDGNLPEEAVGFEFPKTGYQASNARYIFAFGACLARVAVSRVTGEVRLLDIHQHTAAGPMIDAAAYLGQMEGGAVQGLGYTLSEDAPMRDGRYLVANLDTYIVPGIRDAGERFSVFALEGLDADDPLGPRGAGELGIGAISPAIANAVADAIDYCPTAIPFPPEAVLDAMEALQ